MTVRGLTSKKAHIERQKMNSNYVKERKVRENRQLKM